MNRYETDFEQGQATVLTDIYDILEKWRTMQIDDLDCIGEISSYVDMRLFELNGD